MFKKHERRIGKFYEVTDIILGRGSFSTVYLARHNVFGNKIAIKVIDKNSIEEEYVSRNLQREASILKKLKHPNIVNFYEEFTHEHLYCLSMEFVEGSDLSRFLKQQEARRVTEAFAKTLFFQMMSAVYYMHKAHILHRDLKQENILLEYGRVIKIVDFGLSNTYYPRTRLRTHCGSLEYAAPELFEHTSRYGEGVDLWSLGVILYSMVTGGMPFSVHKREDGSVSASQTKVFFKRISQGLTKENWNKLVNVSYDCCNLLESLLQPNQFRRLQTRDAYVHPWLQDYILRRSLPQHRHDLKRRYKHEIIDWMAEKLCVTRQRVFTHLAAFRYDTVSAIYHMAQDTLVKEVLYPPDDLKNSLIHRLTHRQSRKAACFDPYDELLDERYDKVAQSIETDKLILPQGLHSQQKKKNSFVLSSTRDNLNVTNLEKRIGDGDHLDQKKVSILKSNHAFLKSGDSLPLKKDNPLSENRHEDQLLPLPVGKQFRSYKMNRPVRAKPISDVTVKPSNGDCKIPEESPKGNESIDDSRHVDCSSESYISTNFKRNVKLLNEKYSLKSPINPKPLKSEGQSRREWKIKPSHGKWETGDTVTNVKHSGNHEGNLLKTIKPVNGRQIKINKAEVDHKEDFQYKCVTRSKTCYNSDQLDQRTKNNEQKSAVKDSAIQLTTRRQKQQRPVNLQKINNSSDIDRAANTTPGLHLPRESLPAFAQLPPNGFLEKLNYRSRTYNENCGS